MSQGGGIPGDGGANNGWGGPAQAYLPPVTSTPDWAALAQEHERDDRRRRMLKIGGAALGALLAGGIVAGAVAVQKSGGGKGPDAAASSAVVASNGPSAGVSGTVVPSGSPSGSASPSGVAPPSPTVSQGGLPTDAQQLDDRSGHHPFALAPGAVVGRTDGHSGPTLVLKSSPDSYGEAASAVVDTGRSFTVSAMVRNNAPTGGRSVISQGSGSYYAFDLGRDYWADHNQWVFKVQTAAGAQDNTTCVASSKGLVTTGTWTLLTGVYDASAGTIALYVNGELAQTTPVKGIWQTSGPLQIGRVRYKSAWADFWDGALSDVQVWNQALPPARVAQLGASRGTAAGTAPYAAWLLP